MPRSSRLTFYSYHIEVSANNVQVTTNVPGESPEPPPSPLLLKEMQERVEQLVIKVRGKTASADDLNELGELLYQALFGKQTQQGAHFRRCLERVVKKKSMLRVTLDLDEGAQPEVAALPWEALRAPQESGWAAIHLASDPRLTFSRQRKMWSSADPRPLQGPVRIQLVIANPRIPQQPARTSLGPVEYETVWAALQLLAEKHRNLIAPLPDPILHADAPAIARVLNDQPDILHFIGHGQITKRAKREIGQLALIGVNDFIQWTDDTAIANLFKRYQPALIFLQACEGGRIGKTHPFIGVASQLVHQNIPVVLAMQYPVRNVTAATIATNFYERLIQGEAIDKALQEARYKLSIEQNDYPRDAITPVLFSRLKEGQLFESTTLQRKPAIQPFSEQFIANACHPIAVVCDAYNRATETVARFAQLDAILVNSIKYLAIIALAQYRSNSPNPDQLRTWLTFLAHPTLSAWTRLLSEIADYYESTPGPLTATMLRTACKTSVGENTPMARAERSFADQQGSTVAGTYTAYTFINQLVAYREKTWGDHPGRMGTKFCAPLIPVLQAALQHLWEVFDTLLTYPLRFITRLDRDGESWIYTQLEFRGPQPAPTRIEPFRQATGTPQSARRLYLCTPDGQPLLNLHPFLAYIENLSAIYFIDYNDHNRKIRYLPCGQGEAFIPPTYFSSFMLSLFNDEAEDPATVLKEAEDELDKLNAFPQSSRDVLLKELLARIDTESRQALELALGDALRLGHFWLGVEFLLMGLSRQDEQLFPQLLNQLQISPGEFRALIRHMVGVAVRRDWRNIDVYQSGRDAFDQLQATNPYSLAARFIADGIPPAQVTPRMLTVLQRAANLAEERQINLSHLLAAALEESGNMGVILFLSLVYKVGWSQDKVRLWVHSRSRSDKFATALQIAAEPQQEIAEPPAQALADQPPSLGPDTVLGKYGRDLTTEASRPNSTLHRAEGETAHQAMLHMGRILLQREANNPILLGEPGVGKTAIVEGLAFRLAKDQVLPQLANRRIIELTVTDLLSGTELRGKLEERIRHLLSEVKEAQGRIVIFIDEIHTILGGRAEGSLRTIADALKPALARGEFPCIGATTVHEYRRHIEKDMALTRRFTPVWIEEPSIDEAIEIVRRVTTERLAVHHGVTFHPEAIKVAVEGSARYLHNEHLPGKAIKILDQAASSTLLHGSLSLAKAAAGGGMVSVDDVLEVIAARTNIPISQLGKTDKQRLRELERNLKARVKGQDDAVRQVAEVIRRAGAGLADRRRPLGVFLFAGPTGVGKTELALALTEALFDNEDAMLRLNMAEYMEKHQVSRLIGAPPGYVGYEDEGQLTGHLRRRPYSVILLDEMEKAHEDIQHLFLQLFDNGRLNDAHGMVVDGRNAVFIMTTNLKTRNEPSPPISNALGATKRRQRTIEDHFSAEFRNRIDCIVNFQPLSEEAIAAIFDREFSQAIAPLIKKGIQVAIQPDARAFVCKRGVDQEQGARPLRRAIEHLIVSELTTLILNDRLRPKDHVRIGLENERLTFTIDWDGAK